MITYQAVNEKFKDKGYWYHLFFLIPIPRIFDPPSWQLQYNTREELFEKFKKNDPYYKDIQEKLEYYNTWIDYQNPIFLDIENP